MVGPSSWKEGVWDSIPVHHMINVFRKHLVLRTVGSYMPKPVLPPAYEVRGKVLFSVGLSTMGEGPCKGVVQFINHREEA